MPVTGSSVYARKLSELYSAWSEDLSNSDFGQLQFEYRLCPDVTRVLPAAFQCILQPNVV